MNEVVLNIQRGTVIYAVASLHLPCPPSPCAPPLVLPPQLDMAAITRESIVHPHIYFIQHAMNAWIDDGLSCSSVLGAPILSAPSPPPSLNTLSQKNIIARILL
jgi:hypothetical protein